jgi:hypothetical protein
MKIFWITRILVFDFEFFISVRYNFTPLLESVLNFIVLDEGKTASGTVLSLNPYTPGAIITCVC